MGNRKSNITDALTECLTPLHLEVEDESHKHSKGQETHYNLLVVSERFDGMGRLDRHRAIHEALAAELSSGLHALTMTLWSPSEYELKGGGAKLSSPSCMGGPKKAPGKA